MKANHIILANHNLRISQPQSFQPIIIVIMLYLQPVTGLHDKMFCLTLRTTR